MTAFILSICGYYLLYLVAKTFLGLGGGSPPTQPPPNSTSRGITDPCSSCRNGWYLQMGDNPGSSAPGMSRWVPCPFCNGAGGW
jgi:hypothetical protein